MCNFFGTNGEPESFDIINKQKEPKLSKSIYTERLVKRKFSLCYR